HPIAGRQSSAGTLGTEVGEHLTRSDHDLPRQSGQLSDVDAITAVGGARDHLVQEDDALALLADLHPEIRKPRQAVCQRGELVIVRGEECQGLQLRSIMKVLEDGLRDADPVIGARAPTDLIEDQQAAWSGMGQDVRRLHHLHHEGRQSAGQLVVRADSSEDAIADPDDGPIRGNIAAKLRQQDDDPRLPQIGRLPRHVLPAEQHYRGGLRFEPEIVWDKSTRSELRLHQGMAAAGDVDPGLLAECGSHPAVARGHGGEGGHRVELTQRGREIEQIRTGARNATAELAEERLLSGDHCALRVEHQRLLLFQLWCDIPLAVDERLLAYVPGGDRLPVGVADLEVITEYLVEPDLERPDPRALPFELLESGDPVAGG